ncbi:Uncharacterised protein [Mycobacteroides abscessus subsp. abscessus]|nr:Uncharacterised protein [Mycobacteroides abscessus subsp. abscessus]
MAVTTSSSSRLSWSRSCRNGRRCWKIGLGTRMDCSCAPLPLNTRMVPAGVPSTSKTTPLPSEVWMVQSSAGFCTPSTVGPGPKVSVTCRLRTSGLAKAGNALSY